MFFWSPNTIKPQHQHQHQHQHQNFILIFTTLAAILFLIAALYGVLSSATSGQIGSGLRKVNIFHIGVFVVTVFM
jgi:hypothetical protein